MARYVIRLPKFDPQAAAELDARRQAREAIDARDRRFLDVDASGWRGMADVYEAVLHLLGIAELSDRSPGGLVEAMVQGRTRNIKPPYTLRVSSLAALPGGLAKGLRRLQERVCDARTKSEVDGWPSFGVKVELLPHRGLRVSGKGKLIIDIDASRWSSSTDLYDAILPQLGAPDWHGANMNALIESIIWGEIDAIEPPYVLRIRGTADLPPPLIEELGWLEDGVRDGRREHMARLGRDVEAAVELLP